MKTGVVHYKYMRPQGECISSRHALKRRYEEKRRAQRVDVQEKPAQMKAMANTPAAVVLAALLLLSGGVLGSSAQNSGECFFNTKGSCEHMGQAYGIGESWITSDCYQCVCMEPFGVGCCDHGSKPVDYPDWCEIIRKPDSCTSVAVMRVNHKLPCLWGRERFRSTAGQAWKSDNDPLF